MSRFSELSPSDKRQTVFLILWLIAGAGMLIMGIAALNNSDSTISAVSGLLGAGALVTGILTTVIRIFQVKTAGVGQLSLDGVIWIILAVLLFNTDILNRLGKLVFVIGGIVMLIEGVRSFFAAYREKNDKQWYIPRIVFSVIFVTLGIIVIVNAEKIFRSMIVLSVGIYFIVHGLNILYDWIGRVKYFRNFRGLD